MSKRAQESTAKEGSAVAKPRPMSLVSRNLLRAKKISTKDSGASDSPENEELDQSSVSWSARKLLQNNDQGPTRWQSVLGHQETGAEWWQSNRKDKVGIPQYANLRPSISWESLQELATEIESRRKRHQYSTWGPIYWSGDYLCRQRRNFGSVQEHKLRWAQAFGRYHAKIDIGTWSRDSECIYDWLESFLMDEIYADARSSNQVDESKSTRLHRFRQMLGEAARSFRSKPEAAVHLGPN